jgi:hypothetical protein
MTGTEPTRQGGRREKWKPHILDSAAAEHPDERGPFGGGLGAADRQLRSEQLGVIQSGDQIAVTGQVRGQKGTPAISLSTKQIFLQETSI